MGPDDYLAAAEYVLGVLEPQERAASERRAQDDPDFAALVAYWEARLSGLAAPVPEVAPSRAVKRSIDRALFGPERRRTRPIFRSVVFWQAASGAMASIAIVLGLLMFTVQERTPPSRAFVAALAPAETDASIVVRIDIHRREVKVRAPALAEWQEALELWLIPKGQPPRSLGLLRPQTDNLLPLSGADVSSVTADGALAISVEPVGGSPTGQPTGPILALGALQQI